MCYLYRDQLLVSYWLRTGCRHHCLHHHSSRPCNQNYSPYLLPCLFPASYVLILYGFFFITFAASHTDISIDFFNYRVIFILYYYIIRFLKRIWLTLPLFVLEIWKQDVYLCIVISVLARTAILGRAGRSRRSSAAATSRPTTWFLMFCFGQALGHLVTSLLTFATIQISTPVSLEEKRNIVMPICNQSY